MKLILAAALLTLATTFGPAVYGPPEGGPHMPERGSRIAAVAALHAAAQRPGAARASNPTSAATLPPILMTCPHHPDVLETKPGTCPVCRLPLVPVRIDSAWMCPVHTAVIESSAGSCRMCGRQLVPVTVSLTWTCAADPAKEHLEPGICADGSSRVMHRALRAHGNHNPQHGGQFFMAPDNWHHLEGVHPSARVFRLYLYDDYARPLPAAAVKAIQARVVTKEAVDPATRKPRELAAFPLKPVPGRPYLEARIDPATLPAELTAKVRFARDAAEYRFDFTFASLSQEPGAPVTPRSAAAPRSSSAARASRPAAPTPAPSLDPLTPAPIPTSAKDMLQQLDVRARQVGVLIGRGDFSSVWVPAFQAKDIAVALEPYVERLASDKRGTAEPALTRVVRTAWLLDAAGDVGNRAQIEAVHAAFTAAVADTLAAFAELR